MGKIVTKVNQKAKENQIFLKYYHQLVKDCGIESGKDMSAPELLKIRDRLIDIYGTGILGGIEREELPERRAAALLISTITDELHNASPALKKADSAWLRFREVQKYPTEDGPIIWFRMLLKNPKWIMLLVVGLVFVFLLIRG